MIYIQYLQFFAPLGPKLFSKLRPSFAFSFQHAVFAIFMLNLDEQLSEFRENVQKIEKSLTSYA